MVMILNMSLNTGRGCIRSPNCENVSEMFQKPFGTSFVVDLDKTRKEFIILFRKLFSKLR
jgi:hypothetical protein